MVEQLDDAWKEDMMQEMHPIASELMENQYGSECVPDILLKLMTDYVVQSVIAVGGQEDRQKIIDSLKGRMLASKVQASENAHDKCRDTNLLPTSARKRCNTPHLKIAAS